MINPGAAFKGVLYVLKTEIQADGSWQTAVGTIGGGAVIYYTGATYGSSLIAASSTGCKQAPLFKR